MCAGLHPPDRGQRENREKVKIFERLSGRALSTTREFLLPRQPRTGTAPRGAGSPLPRAEARSAPVEPLHKRGQCLDVVRCQILGHAFHDFVQ